VADRDRRVVHIDPFVGKTFALPTINATVRKSRLWKSTAATLTYAGGAGSSRSINSRIGMLLMKCCAA
jgi:hypothetical protein